MSATLTLNSNRRFLTFLTRRFSHPWMPMALFIPLGALLIALAQKIDPRGWAGVAAWIAGGVLLIAAPSMASASARHWIVATLAFVFAFSALGNAIGTHGRHFGWIVLSAVAAMAVAGY